MDPRASFLIDTLGLAPHPEGGFFREVIRSSAVVTPSSSSAQRSAITSIYFLLPAGHVSRWHRLRSDEIWHFLEGETLELHTLDPSLKTLRTHLLGPASDSARPIHIVPANQWQAALPSGAFTLVGCTMGPGFEFEDFAFLAENEKLLNSLKERYPQLTMLL